MPRINTGRRNNNKCIGDDTKAAARQSPNCIQKIKYNEKRFSIWRMELLHPAMWQVALGWHAMEFAQTSAILEFYIRFRVRPYHRSRHSAPVCEILSKSDHPQQKIMTSSRYSRWRISAILDFRGPIMVSLRSQCTTSYRLSIDTIALNCLVFWENRVLQFGDRQTDKQTNKQTNRRTDGQARWMKLLSLSRAAA